jgi:hypothetical protein
MAIALNANEKLTCTCMCAVCGGDHPAYGARQWQTNQARTHCKNQRSGCGFSTGQEASFTEY